MKLTKRSKAWMIKLQGTMLADSAEQLIAGKSVEVGYRATCGCTDQTLKDYRVFQKFIAAMRSQGINVSETPVKHSNRYATNNGGFWNSYIFEIIK
jgi:hypothetical protein